MSRLFEELDRRPTAMGEISLRRRLEPTLQVDVFEAMLGEEHLMSSLFTVAEVALADLALPLVEAPRLDVVVGGLGLGYTADAALRDPACRLAARDRGAGRGDRLARARPAAAVGHADR